MEKNISFVISALCDQSAMKSDNHVIIHSVCGQRMLDYALKAARSVTDIQPLILLEEDNQQISIHTGQNANISVIVQYDTPELLKKLAEIGRDNEYIFFVPGNMPLIREKTLQDMLQYAEDKLFDVVALSNQVDSFLDLPFECQVSCFKVSGLLKALQAIENNIDTGADILTDLNELISLAQINAGVFQPEEPEELTAVNDRISLSVAEARMRIRISEFHMRNGVTLIDPYQTYIGPDVKIGRDTVIYPGNVLEGKTSIGNACVLYPNNRINNSIVQDNVTLQSSVILDSTIGSETTVGPYAYIRPGSQIGSHVRIGDFVEVKKSIIGDKTKVSHLTYIGDAELGKNINVGCGVVCVNYDGKRKYKVTIGDNAFIGCNTNLVAPVDVENDSYIAAGSTITERVPAKALAIARARQVNKEGWVDRRELKECKKTEENK